MKYFKNITTAEEIKKQFRAYCVSMHPDKGGDPEEFKEMMAEYNGIIKNFEQAKKRAARHTADHPSMRRRDGSWITLSLSIFITTHTSRAVRASTSWWGWCCRNAISS